MRFLLAICSLLVATALGACAEERPGTPPPTDAFRFPVSVAVLEPEAGAPGVLYVVSSNFDLLYNRGTVIAVDLGAIDLSGASAGKVLEHPVQGAVAPADGGGQAGYVLIDSFAGKSAYLPSGVAPASPASAARFYIPTRSEARLYAVRAEGALLSCWTPEADQDCLEQGLALEQDEETRAPDPFAAAVLGDHVYVTSLTAVTREDSSRMAYLSRVPAADPLSPQALQLIPIGPVPSGDIAAAPALGTRPAAAYFTNRVYSLAGDLVRVLVPGAGGQADTVQDLGIEAQTGPALAQVPEARSVAVSSDGRRLYVTTRGSKNSDLPPAQGPDGLLVVAIDVDPPRVLGFVQLPAGPSDMVVLPRPGRGDVVAVSCSESNRVAFYDVDLGAVTALVEVREPYGLAAGNRVVQGVLSSGKRVYVASFGNHTVDVIDLPDLERPQDAAVIARLGAPGGSP